MVAVSVAFGLYATDTVVYPIDQKKIRLDKNFNLSACLYNVYRCDDFLTDMKNKQRDTRALYSCTGDGNKGAILAHDQVHGRNFVKQFVLRWKEVTETHRIVFLELGSKKDTFKQCSRPLSLPAARLLSHIQAKETVDVFKEKKRLVS